MSALPQKQTCGALADVRFGPGLAHSSVRRQPIAEGQRKGAIAKSRELSAEKAGKNLKLFKQPAETSDLVLDVVLAECVPIGCCIDGDHRFAIAPKFQRQPLSQTMNIYSARVFPKGALLPARVPDADAAPSLFCGRRNSPFLVIALVWH